MSSIKSLFGTQDMTAGRPLTVLARFSIPLLIGNFAQQLYNTVDAVVVGNSRWGYTALGAVGNAMPVLNLLLAANPGKKRSLGCDTADTQDGQNHFWLLKRIY